MKKTIWITTISCLILFHLNMALAGKPSKPFEIDLFYNNVLVLWDQGYMTEDDLINLAKDSGIDFDITKIAPFEQKLIAADKTGQHSAQIKKDIGELVKVVLAVHNAEVSGQAKTPVTSPVDSAKSKAAAAQAASDLAADAAAKAQAASDADDAAVVASNTAAANPANPVAVKAKTAAITAAAQTDSEAKVASAASDAASAKADSSSSISTNTSDSLPFFVTSGAEFQNPYAIVVNGSRGMLTNAGNSTVAFVEFDYLNRYATRPGNYESDTNLYNEWFNSNAAIFGGYLQLPWKHVPDIQVDVGFVFDNGINVSNQSYTAQTLAGGGDFYSDFGFGFPLWRVNSGAEKAQVSLETSGGLVTDKSFEEVHPNAFVGLGIQSDLLSTNCLLSGRVGVGWLDLPQVGAGNVVALDANEQPIFDFKPQCEMSSYILIPIGKVFLSVGANAYVGNQTPNSWNIRVGASIPFSAFKSIVGQ